MNTQLALFNKLKADATLTGYLSSYSGNPAIFLAAPVPRDASLPCLIIEGSIADTPADNLTDDGRDILTDVRVYTDAKGLPTQIEQIVERIRTLLHHQNITVTGWSNLLTRVENIQAGATEPDVYARVLSIRTILEED